MADHYKENIATIFFTVVLILGLYALGAGGWAATGALLLLNINYVKRSPAAGERK